MVVTILLQYVGYDILPAVFEDLPIDSDSEPMYLRQQVSASCSVGFMKECVQRWAPGRWDRRIAKCYCV